MLGRRVWRIDHGDISSMLRRLPKLEELLAVRSISHEGCVGLGTTTLGRQELDVDRSGLETRLLVKSVWVMAARLGLGPWSHSDGTLVQRSKSPREICKFGTALSRNYNCRCGLSRARDRTKGAFLECSATPCLTQCSRPIQTSPKSMCVSRWREERHGNTSVT